MEIEHSPQLLIIFPFLLVCVPFLGLTYLSSSYDVFNEYLTLLELYLSEGKGHRYSSLSHNRHQHDALGTQQNRDVLNEGMM